jgi:hypothetical protein
MQFALAIAMRWVDIIQIFQLLILFILINYSSHTMENRRPISACGAGTRQRLRVWRVGQVQAPRLISTVLEFLILMNEIPRHD